MTANIPADAPRSPDGYYWYDGTHWRLIDQSGGASTSEAHAQSAATYLGLSGAGAIVLADVPASALHNFSDDEYKQLTTQLPHLEDMRRFFESASRHGCWCGPGHVCEDEKDSLDACCHQHDLAYDQLGVTADSMWSLDGLKKTVEADRALVECSHMASGLDADALAYRGAIETIFTHRAEIGQLLRLLDPAPRHPGGRG